MTAMRLEYSTDNDEVLSVERHGNEFAVSLYLPGDDEVPPQQGVVVLTRAALQDFLVGAGHVSRS